MRKLTPKQRLFCIEYLICRFNGTHAAIAAGYRPSNARFYAARLLTKANVRAELAQRAKAAIGRLNARNRAEAELALTHGQPEKSRPVFGSFDISRLPVTETRLVRNRAGQLVTATVRKASGALLQSTWTPHVEGDREE